MHYRKLFVLLFLLCLAATAVSAAPRYVLVRVWKNAVFTQPLDLQFVTVNNEESAFVVQQDGKIFRLVRGSDGSSKTTVLDIGSLIIAGAERGLLGLAIDPKFATNGYIYVNYTRAGDGATVISRFTVSRRTWKAARASELKILTVPQPRSNHNAGSLIFGADRMLYIPLGDGGGTGDPDNNAQSMTTLLGKILRIDVRNATAASPYTVPPTNPFVQAGGGARAEIFALGLRNPFKITRDQASRRIWVADVGQNAQEEVDVLKRGANYGWNIVEGRLCYPSGEPCTPRGFKRPVWTIARSEGESVTGGYVYRGRRIRSLKGTYVYGDFIKGTIWGLARSNGAYRNRTLISSDLNISSFGQDSSGEIYVVNYGGTILQLRGRSML